MKLLTLTILLLLAGCATEGERSLLDRLEFGDDECGTFTLTGSVDTNPNPIVSTNVYVNLDKSKVCPE